jgi:hypothetical protein
LFEHFRVGEPDDGNVVRLENCGAFRISSLSFWGVMVCAVKLGGKLKFDAVKVEDEPCEHVSAAYFGLAKSQVLKPKVLFSSSGVFSEFSSAWREVHWDFILAALRCFSRQLCSCSKP